MPAPKFITFNGKTLSHAGWDRELGFKPQTITNRLQHGCSIEEAMRPINTRKNGAVMGDGRIRRGYHIIRVAGREIPEHDHIAELTLGRKLRPKEHVHHVNGIKDDNRRTNLVICPNAEYHHLLHLRQRALDACGNPTFRKCPYCKQYDDPQVMDKRKGNAYCHNACSKKYDRERYHRGSK